MLLFRTKTILN